jgi:hypothetical protein
VVGWWGRRSDEEGIDNWEVAVQRHVNNACEGAGILLSEALTSENDTRIVEEEKPREERSSNASHNHVATGQSRRVSKRMSTVGRQRSRTGTAMGED